MWQADGKLKYHKQHLIDILWPFMLIHTLRPVWQDKNKMKNNHINLAGAFAGL